MTTDEIRAYLVSYQKINNCGKVTVDNIRRNISSFFSWLEEEDYILKSPMRRIVINLASKEYSKCIEKYLQSDYRYITCIFGELEGDKVVQKGVYAKMARGEMVRFMAGIHAETPEQMKDFNWSGYHFDIDRSSDQEYVFIRTAIPGKGSLPL